MNESNINLHLNCLKFVLVKTKAPNDDLSHLQLSYYGESHKQASPHKLYLFAIIYMNFG